MVKNDNARHASHRVASFLTETTRWAAAAWRV
jgi:hypothetical protein